MPSAVWEIRMVWSLVNNVPFCVRKFCGGGIWSRPAGAFAPSRRSGTLSNCRYTTCLTELLGADSWHVLGGVAPATVDGAVTATEVAAAVANVAVATSAAIGRVRDFRTRDMGLHSRGR